MNGKKRNAAAAGVPAAADSENNRELGEKLASSIPVIGPFVALLFKQGRWHWAVLAVLVLLIYPVVLPLACALIVARFPADLQKVYASSVRRPFQVEETVTDAARKSNKILDYFQVIDNFEDARATSTYAISVAPYQQTRLRISEVQLFSQDPAACPVPAQLSLAGAELFGLEVGGTVVRKITVDRTDVTAELSWDQWKAIKGRIDSGRLIIKIVPDPILKAVGCDELKARMRLSIEVFKDLVVAEESSPDTEVAS